MKNYKKRISVVIILLFIILGVIVILPLTDNIDVNKIKFENSVKISNDYEYELYGQAYDFELFDVIGESYSLSDYKGQEVLVSFIYAHDSSDIENAQEIRAQLVSLQSMNTQYGENGLKVILIDESELILDDKANQDILANFSYDMLVKDIPLLVDHKEVNVARYYDVSVLPTTFLISSEGKVVERWDNRALPAQMAMAIEALQENRLVASNEVDNWATLSQSKFPGLPLSKPLSENIWVVDGGLSWDANKNYPFQILIMNKSDSIWIKLEGYNIDTDTNYIIAEVTGVKLPSDETCMLVTNIPSDEAQNVFLNVVNVELDAGRYLVKCSIKEKEGGEIIGVGEGKVIVE